LRKGTELGRGDRIGPQERERAEKLQAAAFVQKPVKIQPLLDVVESVVRHC
jgi:hypothetical protein